LSFPNPDNLKEIPLSCKLAFRLTGMLLLIWASRPAPAQEFSAEMVRQKPEGTPTTKVSVSRDMARFEVTGQTKKSFVIVNLAQRTSSMVLPDAKSYVVSPPGRTPSSIPLLRIEDPDNACQVWEQTTNHPGTCKKVGDDTVNGRSTVKYIGTAENGDTGTAWVDRKLHFVIKWEGEKSAAELQNIQEGPQAATLFQIPSDYEKLDTTVKPTGKSKAKPAVRKPAH
jgi:hypothetical protein